MKSNQLEKKLKKVLICISIFFLGYLVVGFFLNSNYPIYKYSFNLGKAYEILRDALTLSAYFLAPAMAYVLFNDWRVQHNTIKNEKTSEEVLKIINEGFKVFYSLTKEDIREQQKYNEYMVLFYNLINILTNQISDIRQYDNKCREFTESARLIVIDLHKLWDNLAHQRFAASQFESIALNDDVFSKNKNKILFEILQKQTVENQKNYEAIQEKVKKLKPLVV